MKKNFLLLFSAVCLNMQLSAQSLTNVDDVVSKLQSLATSNVIEKAYLHFDKPQYNPGDTIYFKAYVTAGENHELSKISGVLHVDLISKNDSLMKSIILQLNNGMAAGDFALPAYTPKGNFRVRAYTRWMQNTGDTYFFNKIIPVTGKSIARINMPANENPAKTDVQFFPEGGNMVLDLPSKVAFKAIGTDGLGVNIKGTITDNSNKEVTQFTTAHLGMGQFFLTPQAGKTYTAKINYPNGAKASVTLPKAEEKGFTLNVNNAPADKLSIDINANKAYYLENKNQEISIVMYNCGIVKTVKTVLDNQVIGFDLPKKDLKTGIMQITVFAQGIPVNERLVFIRNDDLLNVGLLTDKQAYSSGDNIKIGLSAKSPNDKANQAYLSVAVVDENKLPGDEDTGSSILTDLLLTTELKGYVEQPGYYFTAANPTANLDILMLTQGYRRFSRSELIKKTQPEMPYKPENGLLISGHLAAKDGRPLAQEKISLLLPQSGQSLTVLTDATGKFNFENLGYADRSNFLIKLDNAAIKNKAVIVLDNTVDKVSITPDNQPADIVAGQPATAAGTNRDETNNQPNVVKLKQVTFKGKLNYRTTSLTGAGNADQVLFRKDFKNASTLSLGLSGRLRGVNITNGKAYVISSAVTSSEGAFVEPMQVIVDGLLVRDGNLDLYNPQQVETVEILKGNNASIYGIIGGAGIIVITTRQGDSVDDDAPVANTMAPGMVSLTPVGFYKAREFYSPAYPVRNNPDNQTNATVYWNPGLITGKDGTTNFNFNSAATGSYKITVEGIDNDGHIGRTVMRVKTQ